MNLLLDTHALLWFCDGSPSLSLKARESIEEPGNIKFVSHASAWEIAIKHQLGRLTLKVPYDDLFPRAIDTNGFLLLPSDVRHYSELLKLPFHHRDPFDRLLVAQALADGLTLVTCDPTLAIYGVPVLW